MRRLSCVMLPRWLLAGWLLAGWLLSGLLPAAAALAADGPPDARCTCRNRDGARHELGAVVCLNVDGRKYLARCEMVLNVTSWQKVQDGCPVASIPAPDPDPRLLAARRVN